MSSIQAEEHDMLGTTGRGCKLKKLISQSIISPTDRSSLQFHHPLAYEDLLPVRFGKDYERAFSRGNLFVATPSTCGNDHLITGGGKWAANDNAEANKPTKEVGGNGRVTSHGERKRLCSFQYGSWLNWGRECEVAGRVAPRSRWSSEIVKSNLLWWWCVVNKWHPKSAKSFSLSRRHIKQST